MGLQLILYHDKQIPKIGYCTPDMRLGKHEFTEYEIEF